jgi:predicted Fe-Mo cluster-binding NifX family protein
MRIAISVEDNKGLDSTISHHFGRCPFFMMVDVDGKDVKEVTAVENPFFDGHEPGMVPGFINEQKANVMIAGGMGRRAIEFFQQYGIDVATGASGLVQGALEGYLGGELSGTAPCKEGHEHNC